MSVQISGEDKENNGQVTYYSLDEYLKMNAKSLNELFDSEIGIKLTAGCNFMYSMFNPTSQNRLVYFNGAQPFHKFICVVHNLFEDYLLENNKGKLYIFSILKGTSYVNISILEGAETENERKILIKDAVKLCLNTIDRTLGIYINEHHKKKIPYRLDTTFKEFETCINEYIKKVRPILLKYL
jgi:hypothetical protein